MKNNKIIIKIGISLLNILSRTWRINYINNYEIQSGVVCFWHNNMLPGWYNFKNKNATAIVSPSRDGDILAKILEDWNIKAIRGSSTKQPKEALSLMIENAKEGRIVLITPDGPQGPPHKMKAGAVITAIRAKVPLYICRIKINNAFIFKKAWDKFELPLPFSKINFSFNEFRLYDNEYNYEEIDLIITNIQEQLNIEL